MDTKEFTQLLIDRLSRCFPPENIKKEWDVGKESVDDFDKNKHYAPRIDVVISPLNVDKNIKENNQNLKMRF